MFTIPGFGRTSDPTWTNVNTFLWSAIELGVGLDCASLPAIYSGLRHVWPAFRKFTRSHISQKGSNSSSEYDNSHRGQNSLSGIPHKAKYHRASSDLPLTSLTKDAFAMDDMEATSADPYRYEKKASSPTMDLNKPVPPLPRKGQSIEASTTVTIVRGPRSPTFDDR
jgi:hypothetical protein